MLGVEKIDHIGIRVKEKFRSINFDTGFERGHPIMMRHPSGIVLNLLGPSTEARTENILMDIDQKHAGYTHIALKIDSLFSLKAFLAERSIEITGHFSFKDMNAIFIRDPDRNLIEFDEYPGDDPSSHLMSPGVEIGAYKSHP